MWLHSRALQAERAGLFRAASAAEVVGNLVWREDSRYDGLRSVHEVDVFISHAWSTSGLLKALAICTHFNLDAAILAFVFTLMLALLVMLLSYGSIVGILEESLPMKFFIFICPSTAAFLLTLFGGHLLRGTTIWFDRLCVSQATPFSKLETLQALPAFVASSRELLVVWDSNLFQRLWVCYELAVFAKTVGSPNTHFIPTWVALWVLASFSQSFLQVAVLMLPPLPPESLRALDTDSQAHLFLSVFNACQASSPVWLMFVIPLSWFCLQKVQQHRLMLDQMSHFDIRDAKCALETDRTTIEKHVLDLFDEASEAPLSVAFGAEEDAPNAGLQQDPLLRESLESIRSMTSYPTKDEILDQFNAYVSGPLRESVMDRLGSEEEVSLKLCLSHRNEWNPSNPSSCVRFQSIFTTSWDPCNMYIPDRCLAQVKSCVVAKSTALLTGYQP